MEILERSEAAVRQLKRYFTGRPCRRGHQSERFTSSGQCIECMKKTVGLFVRISVDVHQDDRASLEMFARQMAEARGRSEQVDCMTEDERHYWANIDRWRRNGAAPHQAPRSYKTFTLPDGVMPW
jgi:hypothetical protein